MLKVYKNGTYVEIKLTPDENAAMEAERIAWESSSEYKQQQIADLKNQIAATDYKALKYFEGWLSEEEYAPIRAERQAIRDRINALEGNWRNCV